MLKIKEYKGNAIKHKVSLLCKINELAFLLFIYLSMLNRYTKIKSRVLFKKLKYNDKQ